MAVECDSVSKTEHDTLRTTRTSLTEDDGDDNRLTVLVARFLGVSCEIGNVQAQGGVVAQHRVQICGRTFSNANQ